MPKINPIQGYNDSFIQQQNPPNRNVSKFADQPGLPIIRQKNKSFYDSVVPIHQVSYNPQFSKSPLASVQISKQARPDRYEPEFIEEDPGYSSKVRTVYLENRNQSTKCDWKTVLCWAGIILGILAFIVGLYFLVDVILGQKTHNEPTQNKDQVIVNTSGVVPIYVNPIPYDSYSRTTPVNGAPTTSPQPYSQIGATYPSPLPVSSSSTFNNKVSFMNEPVSDKPLVPPKPSSNNLTTQKTSEWSIDPLQNSIQPLNAYQRRQT